LLAACHGTQFPDKLAYRQRRGSGAGGNGDDPANRRVIAEVTDRHPGREIGEGADCVPRAKVFTRANRPALTDTPGVYSRADADATEDAIWSARGDTATGYGIAVFDVSPGDGPGGQTSIAVTQYHALGADPVNPATGAKGAPTPEYTEFETFTLVRPRSDP
jgi:hypothetical protein